MLWLLIFDVSNSDTIENIKLVLCFAEIKRLKQLFKSKNFIKKILYIFNKLKNMFRKIFYNI